VLPYKVHCRIHKPLNFYQHVLLCWWTECKEKFEHQPKTLDFQKSRGEHLWFLLQRDAQIYDHVHIPAWNWLLCAIFGWSSMLESMRIIRSGHTLGRGTVKDHACSAHLALLILNSWIHQFLVSSF
jgi:hypothetical protein